MRRRIHPLAALLFLTPASHAVAAPITVYDQQWFPDGGLLPVSYTHDLHNDPNYIPGSLVGPAWLSLKFVGLDWVTIDLRTGQRVSRSVREGAGPTASGRRSTACPASPT